MEEGMMEVDETRFLHIAIGVRMTAVLLGVSSMVAQYALLHQFATVGEVALLVAPVTLVGHPSVISNSGLMDKPFSLQYLCRCEPTHEPVLEDEIALNRSAEPVVPIGPCDTTQAVLMLILQSISRGAETN
jgi:hypothetical protein